MIVTWTFSDDRTYATNAIAAGFSAADDATVEVDGYDERGWLLEDADDYVRIEEFAPPDGYDDATILIHFVAAMPELFPIEDITVAAGAEPLTPAYAEYFQNEDGTWTLELFAYYYVGDPTGIDPFNVEVGMAGIGPTTSAVVNGSIQVLWVNGLADEAPTMYAAGVPNTFSAQLQIAVDSEAAHAFVFTAAAQGRAADASSTLTLTGANVVQGDDQSNEEDSSQAIGWDIATTSYNCLCEVPENAETLSEMRTKLLSMTGYAAQAANPPPGIEELYNAFLDTSQKFLYKKYKALETERFFSWVLEPGVRYYGLWNNADACAVKLNRYKITGAWLQDLNNVWWPLIEGIDPTFYTLDMNFGWPSYYEVRQCIEVFPAPQAAYTLWIKGHFELLPFADDDDVTTIDAAAIQNYATFLAKSHKGMPDAEIYASMAMEQVSSLIAGAHVTKRYIPTTTDVPVPTPPIMVHFES